MNQWVWRVGLSTSEGYREQAGRDPGFQLETRALGIARAGVLGGGPDEGAAPGRDEGAWERR